MKINHIYNEDSLSCLQKLPSESIDCCVTSPPYYALRDYGVPGQIGLEQTPQEYIGKLVEVFREVKRVLKSDGTLWVNIGDSYAGAGDKGECEDKKCLSRNGQVKAINKIVPGCKSKDLIGIPWMLAFALRADGWYLRQDIIWAKPNPMPESVTDRCTKSHEYIFLLSKSRNYYYDYEAIAEKAVTQENRQHGVVRERVLGYKSKRNLMAAQYGLNPRTPTLRDTEEKPADTRNKRSVWNVQLRPNRSSHIAAYPEELIAPCIIAGCRAGGVVLDPFMGSGTTAAVARKLNRNYLGIELNTEYCNYARQRAAAEENLFNGK